MCNARALGWRGKEKKDSKRPAGSWSIYTIAKTAAGASVSETHKRDMIGWWTAGGHYSLLGSVSVCLEDKGNERQKVFTAGGLALYSVHLSWHLEGLIFSETYPAGQRCISKQYEYGQPALTKLRTQEALCLFYFSRGLSRA